MLCVLKRGRSKIPVKGLVGTTSRVYSTKNINGNLKGNGNITNTTNGGITEDSDFAFRKGQIQQLKFAEQDGQYYPTIGECVKRLANNINDRKIEKIRIPEFRKQYVGKITVENSSDFDTDSYYIVSGKIDSIRKAGKGSMFIDVVQDYTKLQLIVHHKIMKMEKEAFLEQHSGLRPGDQIMCVGRVGITKVGELSLKLVKPVELASPALHPIPTVFSDSGKINQNRVVDYLANKESRDVILLRCRVIQLVRAFLDRRGFLEVETPIICSGNSGANATPFETVSQHISRKDESVKLNLRVAPELWLKKLVISGFDKIYEIGKVFRNEGIDSTHNPEFTTCEFYQTFIGLEELMAMSEEMITFILRSVVEDGRFTRFHGNCQMLLELIEGNGGRFRRIDFMSELEAQTGEELRVEDLNRDGLVGYWKRVAHRDLGHLSESELINKLSEEYLETLCEGEVPTFIYNIPEIMSPLSKSDPAGLSHRFELYIQGREYINAYEEENNPFKQNHKFNKQSQNRAHGDLESLIPDHKFVESMEWGMPPTGGWGLGIDRLVMKLANSPRIENVLPFGKLNDVIKQ